jgi:methylated-DNA-[protein]-cysteine S-methyltransferase
MITPTNRAVRTGVIRFTYLDSPLGRLFVSRDDEGITSLLLPTGRHGPVHRSPEPDSVREDAAFDDVRTQLVEYFSGRRTEFDLPLNLIGSPFQRNVWAALCDIPFGATRTYGQQTAAIGSPMSAARAVGHANGQNPVSIIVPCHRVIGADGSLTGYGGGLAAKRWLLEHEGAQPGLFAL